jgi:hypothetical protein
MDDALRWMIKHRRQDTILVVSDARSGKILSKMQAILYDHQRDESKHLRLGVTFQGHPAKSDIRYPGRGIYGGLCNQEQFVGVLPVAKVRMQTRPRAAFSACGEKNSHTQTYTGVPWRHVNTLPRMSISVKDDVTGIPSPAYQQSVIEETRKIGHPLFWQEVFHVEWYINFFKDTNACRVFDLAIGSTAAACAAAYLGIPYEGIAMSKKHAIWGNNIMDKAIFFILKMREIPKDSNGKKDPDAVKLQADLAAYFKDKVEEGRKYIERETEEEDDDDDIEPPEEEPTAAAAAGVAE